MKIRISYPGQAVQVVDAPPHIVEHYRTKNWDLPFVERAPEAESISTRLRAAGFTRRKKYIPPEED